MKTRHIAASFLFCLLPLPVMADTFILKDGTSLVGRILREDPTNYYLEVQITKSIKDEKTVAKADVTKIEREQLDVTAFEPISKLVPAPDFLTSEEYAVKIQTVEKYLAAHRGSSKTKEAKEILNTLKTEANEILAGGVKMNGKIIPSNEYRANAYDIDARVLEAKIRALAKNSQYLQALRAFGDFSRDFRNTNSHTELIPLIEQLITTYTAEISQQLATYDARIKEREVGLQRMASDERGPTENAIREETASFEVRLKSEKDSKIGWVTTEPLFKPSLDETLTFSKQESTRLAALKIAATSDGGKIYRDTLALILSKGDKTTVSTALTSAKSSMIAPRYITRLEEAARASGSLN
jgi:hypothetical protein